MTPPARPRAESCDLASHYETLRRSALDPSRQPEGLPGVALLLRHGVAAWIAASRESLTRRPPASPPTPVSDGCGCPRGDLVRVLVSMVLGPTTEHAP